MAPLVDDARVGVPLATAARVAHVTEARVRRWEHSSLIVPKTRREVGARAVRLYGFDDLVEMRLISELERRGAHIKLVQKLLRMVREHQRERGRAHQLRWAVDQGEPFVELDGMWHGGRRPAQGVIPQAVNIDDLRAQVRAGLGERPSREGLREEKRVGVLGSKPVFVGTRTPVAAVIEYIDRGATDDEILTAFPHLAAEDVEYARRKRT